MNLSISPSPTEAEVAAIVAAIEVLTPKPVLFVPAPVVRVPKWRFSNRWWIAPLPRRRQRPHR